MNPESEQPINQIPIPKLFYSDLTGAPLDKCISCETKLLETKIPYMVEKALKPYDGLRSYATIFEYAMCMKCMSSYQGKISNDSMKNVNQYFVGKVDVEKRNALITNQRFDNLTPWLDKCLIKNIKAEELGECQIYGQCLGDQLIMAEYPYMISREAMDEVVELLSPETLDEFNSLQDELIGPSEFQDLLKGGPRVLL